VREKREKGETIRVYVYIGAQESLLLPPSLDLEREKRDGRDDGFQPHHHHHSSLNDVV
jgi:hypothetical protein